MRSLHLLTYNLWHGLSPSSWIRFKSLEPVTRRSEREREQIELLRGLDADCAFLQEVNPVANRSQQFSEELTADVHWCRDYAGLKLGGLGPPYNLDSGLATMLKKRHITEWTRSIKLSGEKYNFLGQVGSIQWAESRRALLVSTVSPDLGRVLWVNTHLHHGLEFDEGLKNSLESMVARGELSSNVSDEIVERVTVADRRRENEIKKLLKELRRIRKRYSLILMGGDFNAIARSSVIGADQEFGFQALQDVPAGEMLSWDGEANPSNHQLSRNFDSPIVVDDLSFEQKTVDSLKMMLKDHVMSTRQIDYLWGWTNSGEIQVTTSELVGSEVEGELAPSDHMGVSCHIEWSPHL